MEEEWQKFETFVEQVKERLEQVAWHETGHAMYAIIKGVKVKGLKIRFKNYCPVGGTTDWQGDERDRWLMGDGMFLAGMAWQVLNNGEMTEEVVDAMMETEGDGSDWERLGYPSRDKLIGMVDGFLEDAEGWCRNDFVNRLSKAIHDRLLDKGKVTRRDLQAIGKETGWFIK